MAFSLLIMVGIALLIAGIVRSAGAGRRRRGHTGGDGYVDSGSPDSTHHHHGFLGGHHHDGGGWGGHHGGGFGDGGGGGHHG